MMPGWGGASCVGCGDGGVYDDGVAHPGGVCFDVSRVAIVSIGKIQGPQGGGKLKHIDLRQAWIKLLKNRKVVEVVKVPGEANPSDCMTKILGRVAFNKSESELMGRVDEDGRK